MLKIFLKGIVIIDGLLLTTMVFLMIYRMLNGNSPFISLTQIIDYFEEQNIYRHFETFKDDLIDFFKEIETTYYKTGSINDLDDFFTAFKNFFKLVGQVLYTPFYILWLAIRYVIDMIKEIYYFLSYVANTKSEYRTIIDRIKNPIPEESTATFIKNNIKILFM